MNFKWLVVTAIAAGLTYASPKLAMHIDCCEDSCKDRQQITTVSDALEDDYLFLGHELIFSGETQDLVFLGKDLTMSGTARSGFMGAGKKLIFSGPVGNGILAAGGNFVVEGKITGNSYLACKSLRLTGKSVVDGTVFAGCAKATLDGVLNGDLFCGAGEFVLNGTINGNAKIYGGRLVFGEKGKINGNLTYGTKEKLSDGDRTRISGTIVHDEKHAFDKDDLLSKKDRWAVGVFVGTAFCMSFIAIGCLLLLIPAFGKLRTKRDDRDFWNTALYGLVPLIMYPAAIVLSFVFIVTIPFGFILLLSGIPLLFFACLLGTTLTGGYIAAKFGWNIEKRHWHFLIGALAGVILSCIPVINFLWFVLSGALGWGVYLNLLGGAKNKDTTPTGGQTAVSV